MGVSSISWASQTPLTGSRKWVLLALANFADDADGYCFPGQRTLAEWAGISERTVREQLAELERDGWIERAHRMRDGWRTSDEYVVRFDRFTPAPKSRRTLRRDSPVGAADSVVSTGEIRRTEPSVEPPEKNTPAALDLAVESVPKATKPRGEIRPEVEQLATGIVELLTENGIAARVDSHARRAADRILAKPAATSVDVALAVVSHATHDHWWRSRIRTATKAAEHWDTVRLQMPADALAAAAPASQPGRRRNGEWEPLLAEDGEEARAHRFLARSVDPAVWWVEDGRDREELLDRILALPVVYSTRGEQHAALMNAWRLRWEGGSFVAEVPGFVPVAV